MNILETIGHTPLVLLETLSQKSGARIYAKLESRNPGFSIKDRAAQAYIEAAMRRGDLTPGGTVLEATSGNLGIGLALVCAKKGLNLVLAMPTTASQERVTLLRAMGAELILTPNGMSGAQAKVEELLMERAGSFRINQFENPDGPVAHYRTTGPELLKNCADLGVNLDAFVAGVGSGATLCGVSRFLKEQLPKLHAVAVEPAESPVLSGGKPASHGIQGIGAGFVPKVFDPSLVDEIIQVDTPSALQSSRNLLQREAVSCGISSGANALAAFQLGCRPEFQGKTIVTIICDTGERYLSTALFQGMINEAN